MPKPILLSDAEKKALRDFVLAHPELSMQHVSDAVGIPYRRLRKLLQELHLWQPQPPTKQVRDPEILARMEASWQAEPSQVRRAYAHFTRLYAGDPPLTERAFRRLCAERGWEFAQKSPKRFRKEEFARIFCDTPEGKVPLRTLKRALDTLLRAELSKDDYRALDPTLTEEHLFRYQRVQNRACWTCGKTTHFGVAVELDIDHITGEEVNHRLSHLRLLCSCCHRATSTHSVNKIKESSGEGSLYSHFTESIDLDAMKESFEKTRALLFPNQKMK
jgi:hypothetical protein